MKKLFTLLTVIFFTQSCGNKTNKDRTELIFKSWEMMGMDTVNGIDTKGNRQGHWIITKMAVLQRTVYTQVANDTAKQKSITSNPERVKTEEGFYLDNKKKAFGENSLRLAL